MHTTMARARCFFVIGNLLVVAMKINVTPRARVQRKNGALDAATRSKGFPSSAWRDA